MAAIDAVARALRAPASAQDRPVARSHRASARRSRVAAYAPAAGRPCRRHQRQGLDHRLHARRARGGGQARSRLHLAPSGAFQRAHPPRRRAGRRRAARPTRWRAARRSTPASRSRCSRSSPPPRSSLFSETPADYLLLEVGLGGRYDATNVIDRPAATVITPVSIDHTEFLGPTVEQIAFEKAGILRRGAPAIVAEQDERALAVIEREALKVGASRRFAGRDFFIRAENGRLAYEDGDGLVDLPPPRLAGRHQFGNAATAVARCARSSLDFPTRALERGPDRRRMAGAAAAAAQRAAGRAGAAAGRGLARRRPQRSGRPRARRGDGRSRGSRRRGRWR